MTTFEETGVKSLVDELPHQPEKRAFRRSTVLLFCALAVAAITQGCAGGYGKPAAVPPSSLYADSHGIDESLVINGLVEFEDSFPGRHRPVGNGQLTINAETIAWSNDDDEDRNFLIRSAAVKSVTMVCAIRAGGNVCLEMRIETITGLAYHFRDDQWAGGYNERIRRAHDQLEQNFPRIVFAETAVEEIN